MKRRIIDSFVFTIAWLVFPIYGHLEGGKHLMGLFAAYFIMWLIGFALSGWRQRPALSKRKERFWIGVLALLDQVSKLMIHFFLKGTRVIIPYGVDLQRYENVHHSAITSFFNIPVSRWGMGILKLIILALLWYIINETFKDMGRSGYTSLANILLFSGGIASVLDTFFWGYTLDFIYLRGFFTMDVKDLYISLAFGALALYLLEESKREKKKKVDLKE